MREARLREKTKTVVLVCLVLTSLLQVGIHWSRQLQGNPFRFLSGLFQTDTGETIVDERLLKDEKIDYISPNRIVVSDERSGRWALALEGETWRTAWQDLKTQYLPLLVTEKWDKQLLRTTWEQVIVGNRTVLFEFNRPIPADLLPWLTGTNVMRLAIPIAATFPDIEKIAVVPKGSVNDNLNTLYVLSSDGVYRFTLERPERALQKNWYLMDLAALDQEGNQLLSLMGETYQLESALQDLLISNEDSGLLDMPVYEASLPGAIPSVFTTDNLQSLQESILLNRKDSLLTRLDGETGVVTFSDWENTYRVDSNANLAYRYLLGAGTKGTSMQAAFIQAVAFLEKRRSKLGNTDLVLYDVSAQGSSVQTGLIEPQNLRPISGFSAVLPVPSTVLAQTKISGEEISGNITTGSGRTSSAVSSKYALSFTFTFAYRIDGYTVLMQDEATGSTIPPISVTAIADRVVACNWSIRTFTPVARNSWSFFFPSFYTQALERFPFLEEQGKGLSGLRNGYLLPEMRTGIDLFPQWFLESDHLTYVLPMQQGGE